MFSLDRLIEKHVSARPVSHYDRHPNLRKIARAVHRKLAPKWARGNAWEHPLFGLSYKHSSMLFGGFTRNKAYRGDLARCLVALKHYAEACLYVDLADHVCNELGVVVHPTRLFDPLWDPTSLLYGDTAKFFGPRENLALDLHALATERHLRSTGTTTGRPCRPPTPSTPDC